MERKREPFKRSQMLGEIFCFFTALIKHPFNMM